MSSSNNKTLKNLWLNQHLLFFLMAMIMLFVIQGKVEGRITVQEKNTPEMVVQMGHSDYVTSVAFSPDGKTIVSGSDDTTSRIWNIKTETLYRLCLQKIVMTG